MALSNRDRIKKSLELMRQGLLPFIKREMESVYGSKWIQQARDALSMDKYAPKTKSAKINWDSQAVLKTMIKEWNSVFNRTLGQTERAFVHEILNVRNKWAHEENFNTREASRALDSISLLLQAVSAKEAEEVDKLLQELNRLKYEEQARYSEKKATLIPTEGLPTGGLKSWREIVTPHSDVQKGKYQQSEFAADLAQVHRGGATPEYADPVEFFSRTFLTEGLQKLLIQGIKRLTDNGGAPVLKLQTNFGGGKTHSLLALYHLFSDVDAQNLPGLEGVLKAAGVSKVPKANRAILVGNRMNPAEPNQKSDGVETNTFWGEMGYQLLGKKGYKIVAKADKAGVSPGSDALVKLFEEASPCLILIDEWIAYIRQLYNKKQELPAGSFDSNISFSQALTEAAKAVKGCLVVASLPESAIEKGGEAGSEALARLEHVFDRIDAPWRPASGEEGFEIVRRRLFQPITDENLQREKDAVIRAFAKMYNDQKGEFPADTTNGDYKRRMEKAYPIHPELFDRLFNDWSGLERFQRTRGVLRLMAEVIQTLWERGDSGLMILPGMIPIDENAVQEELRRYLDSVWDVVIEKDVDGQHSLPLALDKKTPSLGRLSSARRVSRTIYMGSAPTLDRPNKGIEYNQIKLGCAQPGESVPIFGDALRMLSDKAMYLYVDGNRYWYAPQPTVTRMALERAEQYETDRVNQKLIELLGGAVAQRSKFSGVHKCPDSSGDIPDEQETRLVVLSPECAHIQKQMDSSGVKSANEILNNRGTIPRQYKNTLVFLAPDAKRLGELQQAIRELLAWQSIESEKVQLNLDAFQSKQALTKHEESVSKVRLRIPETYSLVLVPVQHEKMGKIEWQDIRISTNSNSTLVERICRKLENEGLLVSKLGAVILKKKALDEIPLWRGNHVKLKQLSEDFAKYLYLDRLTDTNVLLEAIREGIEDSLHLTDDNFAYADMYDEKEERYLGLRHSASSGSIVISGDSVVVKPEIAKTQFDEEEKKRKELEGEKPDDKKTPTSETGKKKEKAKEEQKLKRFHGSVNLDPTRLGRDAGQIGENIVAHMLSQIGSKAKITLEIHVDIPIGASQEIIRTVTENCKTLKFEDFGFEEE